MGLNTIKPVLGVSDTVLLKPDSSDTETSWKKIEISLEATFQKANNKGADQSVPMCRLVCAIVVSKTGKIGFLVSMPTLYVCFVFK